MTDLRTAAQQALEALELALAPFPLDFIRCQKAAEALRAALAEPVQELQHKPLTEIGNLNGSIQRDDW